MYEYMTCNGREIDQMSVGCLDIKFASARKEKEGEGGEVKGT